jgi:hypothetical protein
MRTDDLSASRGILDRLAESLQRYRFARRLQFAPGTPPLAPQVCSDFLPQQMGYVVHGLILISQDAADEAWGRQLTQTDEGMAGGKLGLNRLEPGWRRMGRLQQAHRQEMWPSRP